MTWLPALTFVLMVIFFMVVSPQLPLPMKTLPAFTLVLMVIFFMRGLLGAAREGVPRTSLDAGSDLLHGDGSYPLPLPMWLPALTAVLMVIFMGSS